jgi:hypothetical protein
MKFNYTLIFLSLLLFTSCAPKIVDTWNIDRYEVINDNKNSMVSQNIGTITFEKNGSGSKNINYDVFQNNFVDKAPFNWELQDGYIKIKSGSGKDSQFNKTWIIVEDKSKSQIWKSTDGKNSIQIIELSKK